MPRPPRRRIDIGERALRFAVNVSQILERLDRNNPTVRATVHQLLRSSTGIGANLEEATGALTKAEFISKCGIALREACESLYWLDFLSRALPPMAPSLDAPLKEADRLVAILTTIVRNARTSPRRG